MDIDVMGREIRGLKIFRQMVEQLLTNAGHDIGAEAGAVSIGDRLTALEEKVGALAPSGDTGLADRLTALEQKLASLDDLVPAIQQDLPALMDGLVQLRAMTEWFASNKGKLEAGIDWLDQNQAPLAELTQIGADLADAQDQPATGGTPVPGTAVTGAAGPAGAGSGADGTSGATDPNAAPAATPAT